MIKSITLHLDSEKSHPYWMQIPKIKNLHIDFIKGVNIICGYNGCGKTSLLRIMRTMTFCEGEPYSKIECGDFVAYHLNERIEQGYYKHIDLLNDWNKSCFNMRTSEQIKSTDFDGSMENFTQFMNNGFLSSGMDITMCLARLFRMIKENKSKDDDNLKDFNRQVMKKNISTHFERTLETDTGSLSAIREYHQSHHVDTDGYTIFLDEPDRSLDVLGCNSLFNIFRHDPDHPFKNSFILVLHNMSFIYRLRKHSGDHINWIELTPGYLDNVERFHEGKSVQRPAQADWLLPKYREG